MTIPVNPPDSPKLSVDSTDAEAPLADPAPFLFLEICRGKTSYPERPVCSPNFVIGSGPSCDLRLGGEDIADAHAVLIQSENDVHLQWLGDVPELLLNGEPIQEAVVSDGDRIGIGQFEFLVRHALKVQPSPNSQEQKTEQDDSKAALETGSLMTLLAEAKSAPHEDEDLSEMSADELVANLEASQESVEAFEAVIRQGEEALLFAAAQRAADLSDNPSETAGQSTTEPDTEDSEPAEAEILEELEKVIHQLSGFSSELDERATRLADQEATQAEAADLLLEAQKELAAQLERFRQQVSENQSQTPPQVSTHPKLRKAA